MSTMDPDEFANTWAAMSEAFAIFAKYGDGIYETRAEDQIITAGPDSSVVTLEDMARLKVLGWRPSKKGGFRKHTA